MIAIDNTLVDHAGQLIADAGWFWDHANERYVIAHDYLLSNHVCPSGAHYPIEWRRFRKQDACQQEEFQDHTALCIELINDAIARGIPGDFTFDSYVTSAKVLNHIQSTKRAYVEDLKPNLAIVVFTNLGSEAGLICKPQLRPVTKPRCCEAVSRNPINKVFTYNGFSRF